MLGGVLAVQTPMNGGDLLCRIIREVTADEKWEFRDVEPKTNEFRTPEK